MARSTCPKCTYNLFEIKEAEPRNSTYKIIFIQCSRCGAVVGTMTFYYAGVLAKDNQEQLNAIKVQLSNLEQLLSLIRQVLRV